jgi:spore coat polysaccharide biosynthesis protein SpsF
MANTVAIIQARMGSARLPGKAMLSLDCTPIIQHVVRRTLSATAIDEAVIATTQKSRDKIIVRYASDDGAKSFRGDEEDVLNRVYQTAHKYNADTIVRLTADNPLLSPDTVDAAINKFERNDAAYVSNKINRTFPSGLDVEVFDSESLRYIETHTTDPYYREHVTPYYRESEEFTSLNIRADEVFNEEHMLDRSEIRLTLDTPDDYELLRKIYANIAYNKILDVRDAIRYIDENGLGNLNID